VVQPIDQHGARNAFARQAPTQFELIEKTNQPEQVNSGGQLEKREPAHKKQSFKKRDEGPVHSVLGRASQIVPELDLEDLPLLKQEEDHFNEIIFKLSRKYPLVPIEQFLPGTALLTDLTPPRDKRTFIRNFTAWENLFMLRHIPRRGYTL
jgi:hypothetical protein